MPSAIRPPAVLALALLASPSVLAQQAAKETPPAKPAASLDAVTVNTAAAQEDTRNSTAARVVVGREELERYGDTSLAGALKRVPGVTVSGTPGRGGEVRLRGLGSGYTQFLINGEPAGPAFSLDSLPPNLVERIEVSRSPTADQSAQAVAGTINIVLKRVVRSGQRELKLATLTERGTPSVFVDTQLADRQGALSYSLAASLRQEKYFAPSRILRHGSDAAGLTTLERETRRTQDVELSTLSATPRVSWKLGERDSLAWDALLQHQRINVRNWDAWTTPFGPAAPFASNLLTAPQQNNTLRNRLSWTRQFDDASQLELRLGLTNARRPLYVHSDGFDQGGQVLLDRHVDSVARDTVATFAGKYRTPIVDRHVLSAGWDGEQARRWEDRIQREIAPTGLPTYNSSEIFDARVQRLAVFAQDEWSLTPALSTYLGLRWESLATRSGNDGGGERVHNSSSVLSPIVQSLWKIPGTQGDQLRLGLSRTYKAPATRDLMPRRYITVDNTLTSPDTEGNPVLRPELSWGVDATYERHLGEGQVLSANLYAKRIRDVILQAVFVDNGRWVAHPVNDGNADVFGIELEAKGRLRELLPTGPAVDLRLNLARNWSRLDALPGPDNRLAQQIPFSANLGADWRPEKAAFSFGGTFGFQQGGWARLSAQERSHGALRRSLDLYGLWKIDPATQLRLSASNLLHQDQISLRTYADTNGSLEQTTYAGTAATLRVALELKL